MPHLVNASILVDCGAGGKGYGFGVLVSALGGAQRAPQRDWRFVLCGCLLARTDATRYEGSHCYCLLGKLLAVPCTELEQAVKLFQDSNEIAVIIRSMQTLSCAGLGAGKVTWDVSGSASA